MTGCWSIPSTDPWATKSFPLCFPEFQTAAQSPWFALADTTIARAFSRPSTWGADGVLVPYINTAEEARQAVSCTKYPTVGTRSVYFPQRSMNKAGLLGYAGNFNNNGIIAMQVETASCIENIAEIAAVPGVDILFLGQNDLCMSMGLYEKYEFPHMYTSPELGAATQKLVDHARKNKLVLGLFLFGTARVGEFLEKGFTFISVGNDLHHVLTQAGAYVNDIENIAKEKGKNWKRRPTALF